MPQQCLIALRNSKISEIVLFEVCSIIHSHTRSFCSVQRRYYQPHTPNGAKKAENRWLKNEQNTKAKNTATGTQAISNGGHRCEWPCWRPTNKNNIVLFLVLSFSLGLSLFHNLFVLSWFLFRRIVFVVAVAFFFFSSVFLTSTNQPSKHTLTCTSICTHARTNWIDQAKFAVDRPANHTINNNHNLLGLAKKIQKRFAKHSCVSMAHRASYLTLMYACV